ncbi:MAG: hypothetical protein KJ672_06060, partial [Candidatus Thermoplasmatota archaeon]|nr:hypothetical protein [Candidatus Thermoplasmatota archaeon]
PYLVWGHTHGSSGIILTDCTVTITNVRTGLSASTVSDPIDGYYQFDLLNLAGGWIVGDLMHVTATKGIMSGWNDAVTTNGAFVQVDVTLYPQLPYFLCGYTTDAFGNPVGCDIAVTNVRTGEVRTTNSYQVPPWPLDGYYQIDLANDFPSGYLVGDLINVTAASGTLIGWNESAVPGGGCVIMCVTLTGTVGIPDFPG